MTQQPVSKFWTYDKVGLLSLVLGIAVGVHIACLMVLHQMALPFSPSSRSWACEKDQLDPLSQEAWIIEAKNEELAHVFDQMIADTSFDEEAIPLAQRGADCSPPSIHRLPTDWDQAQLDFILPDTPEGAIRSQDFIPTSLAAEWEMPFLPTNLFDQQLEALVSRERDALAQELSLQVPFSAGLKPDGSRLSEGGQSSGHIASGSDFTFQMDFAPAPRGGYYFKIALTPKPEVAFKTIRHNLFFLIDRSHSIDEQRYHATKRAVMDALSLLRQGDTFNLFVFDQEVTAFSPHNVEVTPQTVYAAQEFLSGQSYGGLFATTDLYASLGEIIPEAVGQTELNTAILLSDGETYKSREVQRKNIATWTAHNRGKVALYSLAVGKGNNIPLLDLLTSFNKGGVFYCSDHNQVSAALAQLIQKLRNPIGKDLVGNALPVGSGTIISLYPRTQRLPDLYRDVPYVFQGWISRLDDLYLFVQGKYYDRYFDIKQRISFKDAREVVVADLERQWTIHQAYDLYESYLVEGRASTLTEARRLLTPFGIPVAFQ